ncbi:hypothetical protein BDV59DRAFT_174030 [Aspergillus ambiguus]|uniref:uncharacterized protein n=1 Tax=Aspergillus ambiguus TaxID=176160 RepID=UPI003CCD5917
MSDSYKKSSSSYYYSSSSSTTDGDNASGHRYTASSQTNPDGSAYFREAHQDLGEPPVVEEHYYDPTGQERLPQSSTSAGGVRRITDLDEESTRENYGSGMAFREDV